MNIKSMLKNNKGASIVMVIVALLFVGIISSIVLTMTVGNSKATRTTIDNSSNFYSSESALDDFKMYLKKLATSAATEAYGSTLASGETDGDALMAEFFKDFKTELNKAFNGTNGIFGTQVRYEDGMYVFDEGFVKNQVSFDRPGIISIKFQGFSDNSDPDDPDQVAKYPVLRGVEVTLRDENGFETKITTDITFKARMPVIDPTPDDPDDFTYPIDHFVVMAGGSINSQKSATVGTIKGSLYADGDMNFKTNSSLSGETIALKSDYVIAGGDINVLAGNLSIEPINDTVVSLLRTKTESSESGSGTVDRNLGAEVWCDNLKITGANASVTTASAGSLPTDLYLYENLELNGMFASFIANGGRLYGYSGPQGTYSPSKPVSSAVVLNGLGAKLDVSNIESLRINGLAYASLPNGETSLNNISAFYNYLNGANLSEADQSKLNSGMRYFTQGESITYRTLQPLYLIPGEYIKGVGHNPMKESEYQSITAASIDLEKAKLYVNGRVSSSSPYKAQTVRYMGSDTENYVYLFWNFNTVDDAIGYFNDITANGRKYAGLADKQMDLVGKNAGEIILPSEANKVKTRGNIIKYTKNTSGEYTFAKQGKTTMPSMDYADEYASLQSTASRTGTAGEKLTENMLNPALSDTNCLAKQSFDGVLFGPLDSYTDDDGLVTYDYDNTVYTKYSYYLITGPNVELGGSTHSGDSTKTWNCITSLKGGLSINDPTYIIITPGDVDIRIDNFRGMIIAGGNVEFLTGTKNLECLGMISRKSSRESAYKAVPETEFQALLSVVASDEREKAKHKDEDSSLSAPATVTPDMPNTRLRKIFGLALSGGGGGSNKGELVTIEDREWSMN